MELTTITTFGALKAAGYQSKNIKTELRANLIAALQAGKKRFLECLVMNIRLYRNWNAQFYQNTISIYWTPRTR